jgi:hypothetical protein
VHILVQEVQENCGKILLLGMSDTDIFCWTAGKITGNFKMYSRTHDQGIKNLFGGRIILANAGKVWRCWHDENILFCQ